MLGDICTLTLAIRHPMPIKGLTELVVWFAATANSITGWNALVWLRYNRWNRNLGHHCINQNVEIWIYFLSYFILYYCCLGWESVEIGTSNWNQRKVQQNGRTGFEGGLGYSSD